MYSSKNLAKKAIKDRADYIAFGSFFRSKLKPKAKKAMPTKTPTPKPKKKSSGVTFGFEVIPKGGKTKKFSGGGKVGGMKSGSATPNRLY